MVLQHRLKVNNFVLAPEAAHHSTSVRQSEQILCCQRFFNLVQEQSAKMNQMIGVGGAVYMCSLVVSQDKPWPPHA